MEYHIPMDVMNEVDMGDFGMDEAFVASMISTVARSVKPAPRKKSLPHPIDHLKEVMAKRGMCNKDLKIYIGSSGNVCSILKKRKPLSLRMIRNLHRYLDIPAEILIQPYDCH